MSRFQFVADNSATFEVKRLCELAEVTRSSFYAWLQAAPAREARAAADAELEARIRRVHEVDKTVGAQRITAELNDGVPAIERVNHKRVARVMRAAGIAGYVKKRKVRTTVPEPADQKVPDLLKRDFSADAPNQRYVGDITYLPLSAAAGGGNLCLATVIDCYSRRLVGWPVADHMRTELVADALNAAVATRGSLAGAIFHSDHGSVYTSKDYAKLCADLGVIQSMGAVGSSADNALAESFNASLKREILQDVACWPDEATCRRQVFRWIVRLQHPPATLLVPLPVPVCLRGPLGRYAANRGVITPRVEEPGVGPTGIVAIAVLCCTGCTGSRDSVAASSPPPACPSERTQKPAVVARLPYEHQAPVVVEVGELIAVRIPRWRGIPVQSPVQEPARLCVVEEHSDLRGRVATYEALDVGRMRLLSQLCKHVGEESPVFSPDIRITE